MILHLSFRLRSTTGTFTRSTDSFLILHWNKILRIIVSTPLDDRDFYTEHRFLLIHHLKQLLLDDVSAPLNVLVSVTLNHGSGRAEHAYVVSAPFRLALASKKNI